jgi:hypothetical protein
MNKGQIRAGVAWLLFAFSFAFFTGESHAIIISLIPSDACYSSYGYFEEGYDAYYEQEGALLDGESCGATFQCGPESYCVAIQYNSMGFYDDSECVPEQVLVQMDNNPDNTYDILLYDVYDYYFDGNHGYSCMPYY